MVIYNRYVNQEDHSWYDSTNIVYSKCYDTNDSRTKTLKIVFKGGRTYLYKDVDVDDYVKLKIEESTGSAFSKYIKKYTAVRIADTDLEKLNELQETFKGNVKETDEQKVSDLVYVISINNETKEFTIKIGNETIFRGVDGDFSVMNLLRSMNIRYFVQSVEELPNDSDEELDKIVV